MKKFLSLVLALVMTMSLVTISAGAKDFTDDSKLTYKEAVDVISAIGVVDGYKDGAFNPQNTLTRGAAAKIICNLILGPTTASALSADTAPFKDVPANHEFAGYIAYCAQKGIINGYADGTFRPAGTLNGYAFMKMLLGALGYDGSKEGYTGANWTINVAKQALGIKLDDGKKEFAGSEAVTREEACLYAFNTLQATMVEYENKSSIVIGDITVNTSSEHKDKEFSSVGAGNDGHIDRDGKVQFAEEFFDKLVKATDSTDDFGRPANVWKYKSDEIGTYADTASLVATFTKKVTKADIYDAVQKSVYDDLKDGDADLNVYVDGVGGKVAASAVSSSYINKNDTNKVNSSGNGMLTEVYVNDDTNDTTIVSINTWVFQVVSDYSSSKDTVTLTSAGDTEITLDDTTLDGDDFAIQDLMADDYVLVTATKLANSRYDVQSVVKAETVTGNVSSYKNDDNVTIDGTEYKYSLTAKKSGDPGASSEPVKSTQYTVGQDAAVVLDAYGYVIAVDAAVVSDNYVYVSEFAQPSGLSSGKVVGSAFFTDGTTADITVKEAYIGSSMTSSKATIMGSPVGGRYTANAGWYTYSENSAGQYSLYKVENKYTADDSNSYAHPADTDIAYNNKVSFLKGAAMYANDKTIVIVNDHANDEVTAYTGIANLPDITLRSSGAASVHALKRSNNYAYYVYIDVTGSASISGGEDTSLIYFVDYDGQHRGTDNEIYYTYATLDESLKEVNIAADSQLGALGTGNIYKALYKSRTNSDNQLTNITAVPAVDGKFFSGSSGANITYSDGALTLGGTGYTLASGYKITLVTVGELGAAALNKDKDADYEVSTVTGKELADLLKGYSVVYNFEGKTTDNGGSVIEELYVTVTNAVPVNTTPYSMSLTAGLYSSLKVNGTAAVVSDTIHVGDVITFTVNGGYEVLASNVTNGTMTHVGDAYTVTATGGNVSIVITAKEGSKIDSNLNVSVTAPAGFTVTEAHVVTADDPKAAATDKYNGYAVGDLYVAFTAPSNVSVNATGTVTATKVTIKGNNYSLTFEANVTNIGGRNYKIQAKAASNTVTMNAISAGNNAIIELTVPTTGYAVNYEIPTGYSLDYTGSGTVDALAAAGAVVKLTLKGVPDGYTEVAYKYEVTGITGGPKTGTGTVAVASNAATISSLTGASETPTGPVTVKITEIKATKVAVNLDANGENYVLSAAVGAQNVGTAVALPDFVLKAKTGTVVAGSKAKFTFEISGIDGGPKTVTTNAVTAAAAGTYTIAAAAVVGGTMPSITPDGSGAVTIKITKVEITSVKVNVTEAITGSTDVVETFNTFAAGTATDIAVTNGEIAITLVLGDGSSSDPTTGDYLVKYGSTVVGQFNMTADTIEFKVANVTDTADYTFTLVSLI